MYIYISVQGCNETLGPCLFGINLKEQNTVAETNGRVHLCQSPSYCAHNYWETLSVVHVRWPSVLYLTLTRILYTATRAFAETVY